MSPGRGRLVALEGGEGSGKSTQARLLASHLGALLTHEPGATEVGRRIRALVLDDALDGVAPRAEALLMAADRAQHVAEVVEPALAAGRDVVTDRFTGSSLAYQGFGRGLDSGELCQLSAWAATGLEADLVVLLDLPDELAGARRAAGGRDRMEAESEDFHRRVAQGYRSLAANTGSWVVVDGSGPVEAVAELVRRAVAERLEGRR